MLVEALITIEHNHNTHTHTHERPEVAWVDLERQVSILGSSYAQNRASPKIWSNVQV